ncbi:GFA family protein [Paracoccaceae bacterium GXU_MW_L88]
MFTGSCHCGSTTWQLSELPEEAVTCNCTVCRRYGVLWATGYEGENISVSGATIAYSRPEPNAAFHICKKCGCMMFERVLKLEDDGRQFIAVNLRMATDPEAISKVRIHRVDGLNDYEDVPAEGQCVRNLWF